MVTRIEQLKTMFEKQGQPYLLFDIGDHADRFHPITEGSLGKANVQLLNQVGYDAVTIGNNEGITFSKQQLSVMYEQAEFPVLVNNLFENDGSRPPWLSPLQYFSVASFEIGVIGVTVNFQPFYRQLGWHMEDPLQAVAKDVQQIRDHVDFVMILSHLGLTRDRQLAEHIPGIDLILGSHTHHLLPQGIRHENTWIHQVGKFGQYIGTIEVEQNQTDLKVSNQHERKPHNMAYRKYFTITPQAISVTETPPSSAALKLLAQCEVNARLRLAQPVTQLSAPLDIHWFEETPFANLLAEGLNRWCGTEIAVVNAGQLLAGLQPGAITREDLHRICPHPINPCRVRMTGQEIASVLSKSLLEDMQQLQVKGLGFRGEKLGMLVVDGLHIDYVTGEDGSKTIISIRTESEWLQPKKVYEVATVDMFTFGSIYPEIYEQKDAEYYLPEFLRHVLEKRLNEGVLESAQKQRWVEIPY